MTVDIESVAKETDELDEVLNKLKQAEAKKPPEKGNSSSGGKGASTEGKGTGNKSGGTGEKEEGKEGKESRSDKSGTDKEGAKEPDENDEEGEEGEEGEGSGKGDEKEDDGAEEGEGSGEGEEDEEEPEGDEEGAGIDEEHDSAYEDAKKKFEDEVANKDTKPDIDPSKKEKIGEIVDKFEPVVHDEEADKFIEHIRKDDAPKGEFLQGDLAMIDNLSDIREGVKAMLKRVQNISRAPSNSGRLDVRRYIQARLNHADIPVFVNRKLTSLNEGKFLILVDVSGSMWSPMSDFRASPSIYYSGGKVGRTVTRISFEINVGQALQEQLTKMGATVKVFSFGNKLIEGFNDGGGASTEEGLMWVSVYMPYVLQGYTLIFMTDSDIVNGFTDEFRAMTAMQHKRGGGILLWFNDGTSVIPDRLKSAWGSIEAIPVFSKETAMLAIKKLMQKLLTIYT
jgi:hypothetical protein